MAASSSTAVPAAAHPPIPVGVSTYLGVGLSVVAAVGAIVEAILGHNASALQAGIGSLGTALATIGSRSAQAIAAIKKDVAIAAPVVDQVVTDLDKTNASPAVAEAAGTVADIVNDIAADEPGHPDGLPNIPTTTSPSPDLNSLAKKVSS